MLWERDRQIRGHKKALGYLEAVAQAIHAISDSTRSPEAIWGSPTPAEWDHVKMAREHSNDYARRQVRVALRNMKYFKMNVPSRLGSDPPQDRHVRSRSFVSGPRSTLTT
jgi:hypothetical protein